jgi:hypothetical protein
LGRVFGSSGDEDSAVVGLDRTESYGDVEVDVQHLPLLSFVVDVVKSHNLLIELEEVNLVGHNCFYFLLILPINHANPCLGKVIGHGELRIPVKADVLLVVGNFRVLGELAGLVSRFQGVSTASRGIELVLNAVLIVKHLLEEQFVDFNIAIVHDQIFCHKVLKRLSIYNVKLAVLLEPIYHLIYSLFKLIPVLLVLLDLALCP